MKFTLSWLKEFLETDASLEEVSDKLTAIGLEVEGVIDNSASLAPFIVAEILEAEPHPNADKLQVCKVNNGSETLQIVCGAPNARAGIKVVLASVGTVIPTNGMKIKASKIRDVASNGMLCSASELGVGGDSAGIIELPKNAEIGKEFAQFLGLDDPLIEIAITPNRGDCLGVYGIARDLAASGLGELKEINFNKIEAKFKVKTEVNIESSDASLFIGRAFHNVENKESPIWLKQRLESIGLKPISAMVDITNYLTFAYGRPAHVYDLDKLQGNITVRNAKNGEKLKALDENEYELSEGMIVIADDSAPVALGGIIGGLESSVSAETKNILLEIAAFDPVAIAKTGRELKLNTDARYRFERYVPPEFAEEGAEIASSLITEICGGEASQLIITSSQKAEEKIVDFDISQVKNKLGIEVSKKEIITILNNLGFDILSYTSILKIKVPYWRPDVSISEDIVEEVARIHGYDKIETVALPNVVENNAASSSSANNNEKISRNILAQKGLKEVVTFSFLSSKKAKGFFESEPVLIANPISSDLDAMRPSILPNLLEAVAKNQARGAFDVAFFEVGPVFNGATPGEQNINVSGLKCGAAVEKSAHSVQRDFDVFDVKADAIAALETCGVKESSVQIHKEAPDYFHPGRSGALKQGKNFLAYFGEIHPTILKEFDVKGRAVAFEINLNALPAIKKKSAARAKFEVSNFQAVQRDFAFIVDDSVPANDVMNAAKKADKKLITEVKLFDVYKGKGVEEDKKSLALTVHLQPTDKTLSEEEIEKVSQDVIKNIESSTGGILRG